jgi:hypothetical protein
MAYREYGMWEILDVLRRIHRGQTKKSIEAATGRTRKTVRRYLRTAEQLGWSREREPDEELASRVWQKLRPGPAAGYSWTDEVLGPHREKIRSWLSDRPDEPALTLVKVHELLARHGPERLRRLDLAVLRPLGPPSAPSPVLTPRHPMGLVALSEAHSGFPRAEKPGYPGSQKPRDRCLLCGSRRRHNTPARGGESVCSERRTR